MNSKKILYIFGGANGAGKTTQAKGVLPMLDVDEFVNADEIARGLNLLKPQRENLTAGKLFLKRLDEIINSERSFAFEATLAGKTYLKRIVRAKEKGYRVCIIYYWLKSPYISKLRVNQRVKEGGHHIPEEDIRRRYGRSIKNLINIYMPLADNVRIYDNNEDSILIFERNNKKDVIKDLEKWKMINEIAKES